MNTELDVKVQTHLWIEWWVPRSIVFGVMFVSLICVLLSYWIWPGPVHDLGRRMDPMEELCMRSIFSAAVGFLPGVLVGQIILHTILDRMGIRECDFNTGEVHQEIYRRNQEADARQRQRSIDTVMKRYDPTYDPTLRKEDEEAPAKEPRPEPEPKPQTFPRGTARILDLN